MGRLPLSDDAVAGEEVETRLVRAIRHPCRPHPSGAPVAWLNALQVPIPRPAGLRRRAGQVHRRAAIKPVPAVLVLPVERARGAWQGTGPSEGATPRVRRVRVPQRAVVLHARRGPRVRLARAGA